MNRAKWLLPAIVITALALCLAPAAAQDDGDGLAAEIAQKMADGVDNLESLHAKMRLGISINGQQLPMDNLGMEIWMKRTMSVRTEMQFPPIVNVITEKGVTVYNGMAGAALVIPEETMTQFNEQREALMEQAGLNTDPAAILKIFAKPGAFTVVGDVTVDGRECWQLKVEDDHIASLATVAQSFMPGAGGATPDFKTVQMAVSKEDALMRQMDIDMVVTMGGGIEMAVFATIQMQEVETNPDLPDALFAFEVPDDAQIVEWTPDRKADEVMAEFQNLMMQGMPGM